MNAIARNKAFLKNLFAGPFERHGLWVTPPNEPRPHKGDLAIPGTPLADWIPGLVKSYEHQVKSQEKYDDDSVPFVRLWTGTQFFAAAFGCDTHIFDYMPACALPRVETAEEADALPEPSLDAEPLQRVFEAGERVRRELGPDVPIGVPDIQSPLDIAALVWRKEEFFIALYEEPEAAKRLVDKCYRLLRDFLKKFMELFPNANLCHCPVAWAPPELGLWLSEDECGSLSCDSFAEFGLPSLHALSEDFGGMFMHTCAAADHQYGLLGQIPNLRGLNRVFQEPGPKPCIDAFAGRTVLVQAWHGEEEFHQLLDWAQPTSRYLFNTPLLESEDETRRIYDRLRERIEKAGAVAA